MCRPLADVATAGGVFKSPLLLLETLLLVTVTRPPCRPLADAATAGGVVKGLRVPDGARISNSRVKPKGDVAAEAAAAGAGPLIYAR